VIYRDLLTIKLARQELSKRMFFSENNDKELSIFGKQLERIRKNYFQQ